MPQDEAVPGVGDCDICFEPVHCVKILDCAHALCISCANRLIVTKAVGAGTEVFFITCPNCRKGTEFRGVDSLKTRYFGKIKCDFCLGQKEAEDMWWCAECVMTLCSKCSILEHATKNHHITEWNRLEPVKYSVEYIENIKMARQASTATEYNQHVVKAFLAKVEEGLLRKLELNSELEDLKENLLSHYGRNFTPVVQSDEPHFHRSTSVPTKSEAAPKIVAKLLQVAGQNVGEAGVPKESATQPFQIYFSMTPDEAAHYLVSKVKLTPLGDGKLPGSRKPSITPPKASTSPTHKKESSRNESPASTSPREEVSSHKWFTKINSEVVFEMPPISGSVGQCEIAFDSTVVFRSEKEIVFCHVDKGTSSRQKPPLGHIFRHILMSHDDKTLYTVLQSTAKYHDWALQAIDITKSPDAVLYTIDFDIDPEDKVKDMDVLMWDATTMYEIRKCEDTVMEVWRANIVDKNRITKSGHKLKELNLYQKSGIILSNAQIVGKKGEPYMIAYEEVEKYVMRYHLQANRCVWLDRILASSVAPPFCIGGLGHMWIFDARNTTLSKSSCSVTVTDEEAKFEFLAMIGKPELTKNLTVIKETGPDTLLAVGLSIDNVILYKFSGLTPT